MTTFSYRFPQADQWSQVIGFRFQGTGCREQRFGCGISIKHGADYIYKEGAAARILFRSLLQPLY